MIALHDPSLSVRVIARRPMVYRRGADAALDRPAYVRAASALSWLGDRLIVIQDDAAFLGVVDPATGLVDDVPLAVIDGVRQFGVARGNKRAKPDLEAAFVDGGALIAVGSGGPHAARQVIVVWTPGTVPRTLARPALFAALAAAALPAGTSLNLEGAVVIGDELWLANRGGDRAGDAVSPDAILRWPLAQVRALVDDPAAAIAPPTVTRIELGGLEDARLHFADLSPTARAGDPRAWFLAAAEATASFFDDGAVRGSALGVIDAHGARLAIIHDDHGAPTRDKIEGVAPWPGRGDRAYAVVDADDPDRPADLLELALDGAW